MTNKNNEKKTANKFESLKKLSSLLSNNDFSVFVGDINKSKKDLENFCKLLNSSEKVTKKVNITENVNSQPAKTVENKTNGNVNSNNQRNVQNNQNGYQPRQQGNFQNREGGYQPRQNNGYQNREGGYQPRQGGFQNREGYQPRQQGNFQNREGGYQPRQNGYQNREGGYQPRQGGFQNREGGYQPRQGGFQNRDNRQSFNKDDDNKRSFDKKPSSAARSSSTITPIIQKPERTFGNKNKTKSSDRDSRDLSLRAKIRMGHIEVDNQDEERLGRIRTPKMKKAKSQVVIEKTVIENAVITNENLTVKILAEKIGKPAVDIIKKFMMLGMMPNINSVIDFATAELVAAEFGVTLEQKVDKKFEEQLEDMFNVVGDHASKRPPIVTVMGHVDHGKTSLLDKLKKTNVTSGEAGGITQHIGAYSVEMKGEKITFIDTPGHAAFTAMRARGAKVTDIAILVVAADDGIMPQTIEAIHHIKEANVPMIVAINKMDKPTANPDRIKQQLTEHEIIPEEWGGDAICVPISAMTGQGLDDLLENILLVADVLELKGDATLPASGYIIESKIDKGRGVVGTALIINGSLHVGDYIISGVSSGRVKAMVDHTGKNVKVSTPGMAVEVLGLSSVPTAGEQIYVVDEKLAKNIIAERQNKLQHQINTASNNITLEDFLNQSADNQMKVLKLIVKADVIGSSEAIKQTLEKISNEEVKVQVIYSSVGGINESDVLLAHASQAIIIAFNTRPDSKAKVLADRNGIEIKNYSVIYDAVNDVTDAINGMLTPKFEESVIGKVEIRQVFKVSALGSIAGCYVLEGVVNRNSKIRLIRDNIVVTESEVETLQSGKDQAKTMKKGFECGIKLKNYNDIKVNDILEVFEMKQI